MMDDARPEIDDLRHALDAFAEAHRGGKEVVVEPDAALLEALHEQFPDASPIEGVSEDDLVHAAYDLLADDEQQAAALHALATGPRARSYAVVETAAAVTAVLLILQTHVRIERTPSGKVKLLIEKKPTQTKLLEKVVSSLLGFWRGPQGTDKEAGDR